MNDVVFLDGDYVVVQVYGPFGVGFNCYKSIFPGGAEFVKINDRFGWFTTEEAAKQWLYKFINDN